MIPNRNNCYPVFCGQEFVGVLKYAFPTIAFSPGYAHPFYVAQPLESSCTPVDYAISSSECVEVVYVRFGEFRSARPKKRVSSCRSVMIEKKDRQHISRLQGTEFWFVAEYFS